MDGGGNGREGHLRDLSDERFEMGPKNGSTREEWTLTVGKESPVKDRW